MSHLLTVIIFLEIYIILSVSINFLSGKLGLISLGHASVYGASAYVYAIFLTKSNFNFITAFILSISITTIIFTLLFVFLSYKLRNLYFTLSTIAIQIIFLGLLNNTQDLTNGPSGISSISRPKIFDFHFSSDLQFLIILSFFTFLIVSFYLFFSKSFLNKYLIATREDELWLNFLGKSTVYFKFVGITISFLFASIAGVLYASYIQYIDPKSFSLELSIVILSMILIGGTRTVIGPIIGALVYTFLPELLRVVNISNNSADNLRVIFYSVILILIVRFKPDGIFGKQMKNG